jgi:hypothetical protein
MKKIILSVLTCATLVGCTSTQQQIAFNSLSTVETTATSAYQGYLTLVVQGKVSTNNIPQVSAAYNVLQSSVLVATLAVQNNTNALAPANVITEAAALTSLITTSEQIK